MWNLFLLTVTYCVFYQGLLKARQKRFHIGETEAITMFTVFFHLLVWRSHDPVKKRSWKESRLPFLTTEVSKLPFSEEGSCILKESSFPFYIFNFVFSTLELQNIIDKLNIIHISSVLLLLKYFINMFFQCQFFRGLLIAFL